jgi:erythromycin esterase-like protein
MPLDDRFSSKRMRYALAISALGLSVVVFARDISKRGVSEPLSQSALELLKTPKILAVGEASHGAEAMLRARNQLILDLGRRRVISEVLLETGFAEARSLDRFVRGGPGEAEEEARRGFTNGFGNFVGNVDLLRALRALNLKREPGRRIGIVGIDLSLGGPIDGAPTMAPVRCALDGVEKSRRPTLEAAFAAAVRPGLDTAIVPQRQRSAFHELSDQLQSALLPGAAADARICARIVAQSAAVLDATPKSITLGSIPNDAWASFSLRDQAMATNAFEAFRGTGGESVLLFAHTSHVLREPRRGGQMASQAMPPRSMGGYLQAQLPSGYAVIAQIEHSTRPGKDAPDLLETLTLTCAEPCVWRSKTKASRRTAYTIGINGTDQQVVTSQAADGFLTIISK